MNQQHDLSDLLIITQAKYQQQQQSFQKIVSKENALRRELARLDEMHEHTQNRPNGAREMQAIGADIAWLGWLGRAKSEVNLKLARVMAKKLHHLAQVRQSYGKVMVVQQMMDQSQSLTKARKAQDVLSQAIQHSLHT